jgi:hypothetical protein
MNPSRRDALRLGAAALAGACLACRASAQADAPGQCKVVEGPINPKGWCAAFVKKP